jgi:nitrite reductase/ring-hydroxylating ferredoxin subunit
MKYNISKILIFFVFASFFSVLPACEREDRIPYAPVDFVIYLDLPEFQELKTPGNYLYVTGGVRGIIMYCEYTDSYKAYERNCPYEPANADAVLSVDSTGLFMVCRHCESKFMLLDGSVVNGPTKYPLVQYPTYLQNNVLTVSNYDSY